MATNISFFIKGNKYIFLIKVTAKVQLISNFLRSRVGTIQKGHIYHRDQYQTFYGKTKCDLLNVTGVQMRTIKIFMKWQY